MNLKFYSLLMVLIFSIPSWALDHSQCKQLFFQQLIAPADRDFIPPLLRDSNENDFIIHLLENTFVQSLVWNDILGDAHFTRIELLTAGRGTGIQFEFTLSGEALNSRVTSYIQIVPKANVPYNELSEIPQLSSLEGTEKFFMSPVINDAYMDQQPPDVRRQMNKDLVRIASAVIHDISPDILMATGVTIEKAKLNLELQARGLHVVDSVLNARDESPAMWIIRLYIRTLSYKYY